MLFAATPIMVRAQSTLRTTGAVDGVVVDTGLVRLAGATVSLIGTGLQVTTGLAGHFAIGGLPEGRYVVVVRRIGYAPLVAPIEVAHGDTVRSTFALEPLALTLDTVSVLAPRGPTSRLDEFEQRRRLGQGAFFTEADIRKRNPVALSDMFRTLPSVTIAGTAFSRRMGLRSCPFQFFLDGVALPTPKDMDRELPVPEDLGGIEVYANTAYVPPQFMTTGNREKPGGAFCGVIVLWTKMGGK